MEAYRHKNDTITRHKEWKSTRSTESTSGGSRVEAYRRSDDTFPKGTKNQQVGTFWYIQALFGAGATMARTKIQKAPEAPKKQRKHDRGEHGEGLQTQRRHCDLRNEKAPV